MEVARSGSAWCEDIKVWTASVRLNSELPDPSVLSQLLYGDPSNSARNADVICLFVRGLRPHPKEGTEPLRHFFAKVVETPEDYIFNEADSGLAFPNVPALPIAAPAGSLAALYCCVHRRNIGDWELDGNLGFADVFPLPVRLTCRVQPPLKGKVIRGSEQFVLIQDVVLATHGNFLHLKVMAAHLDPRAASRELQLSELDREFLVWRQAKLNFAGILFGDVGSRLVVFSQLIQAEAATDKPKKKEKKNKEKAKVNKMELTEEGVTLLCELLSTAAGRRALLSSDSLYFTGTDGLGQSHTEVEQCNQKLRQLFFLHMDLMEQNPDYPIPLPTFSRKSVETLLLEGLGFSVRTEGLLTWDQLSKAAENLKDVNPEMDIKTAYAARTQIQPKYSTSLVIQCGWLDNVGVYRHGIPARLFKCDTDKQILAFDHVPVKGSILITPPGSDSPVRVWVGSIKLDNRTPDHSALEHFMYGNSENSADRADIIALFCTDLYLDADNVESMRFLLRQHIRNPEDYVFSEEDPGIGVRNIPAALVKIAGGDPRYVALFVCVHRRIVGDFDGNDQKSFEDTFQSPAALMCRSHLRNELAPNFKAHMVQDLVLCSKGNFWRLVLFGLNFDTFSDAQLKQVEAMERYMRTCQMNQLPYTAIVFGDFNNRLVCVGDNAVLDRERLESLGPKDYLNLSPEGLAELDAALMDPVLRRKLYLERDSWSWTGVDGIGQELTEPPLCFVKLDQMFQTMRDLVKEDPDYEVPLPTYKRTPVNRTLTKIAKFKLEVGCLVTADRLRAGFRDLRLPSAPTLDLSPEEFRELYFAKDKKALSLDTQSQPYPMVDLGWPDGVGVYKNAPSVGRIEKWTTAEEFLGSTHAPTRSTVVITFTGYKL